MTRNEANEIVAKRISNGGWSSIYHLVSELDIDIIYEWLGEDIGEDEKIEE